MNQNMCFFLHNLHIQLKTTKAKQNCTLLTCICATCHKVELLKLTSLVLSAAVEFSRLIIFNITFTLQSHGV